MPVTTKANVLTAAKTGLATNPADPKIVSLLKGIKRQAKDPVDATDILKDASDYLNQSIAVLNAAGLGPLQEHLAVIAGRYFGLVADDPTPGVIDQKKLRARVRQAMVDVAAEPWLRDRLLDFKRRTLLDYQATDPCEVEIEAALAVLRAPATEAAAIAASATLQRLDPLMPAT